MKNNKLNLSIILCCVVLMLSSCGNRKYERLIWPDGELADTVPKITARYGQVAVDLDETLLIYGNEISKKQYDSYIEECKKAGFTIDAVEENLSYTGFNNDGYKITARYDTGNEKIELTVNASLEKKFGKISWPKSEVAAFIPVPDSSIGFISWETSDGFVMYVGETSKNDYHAYVDRCWNAGFNMTYSRGDDYFWADDENGNKLTVRFEGNETIFIRADASATITKPIESPAAIPEPVQTPLESDSEPIPNDTATKNLTIENCQDLADILMIRGELNQAYSDFVLKYNGALIEFDACITYLQKNPTHPLRWDMLIEAGDYVDADTRNLGPEFYFTDVRPFDFDHHTNEFPSYVYVGSNVRVVAKVYSYKADTGHFELKPKSISAR